MLGMCAACTFIHPLSCVPPSSGARWGWCRPWLEKLFSLNEEVFLLYCYLFWNTSAVSQVVYTQLCRLRDTPTCSFVGCLLSYFSSCFRFRCRLLLIPGSSFNPQLVHQLDIYIWRKVWSYQQQKPCLGLGLRPECFVFLLFLFFEFRCFSCLCSLLLPAFPSYFSHYFLFGVHTALTCCCCHVDPSIKESVVTQRKVLQP